MNVLALQEVTGFSDMPWFDEYSAAQQQKQYCNVYNDGSAYIAVPQVTKRKRNNKMYFRNAWDDLFDDLYAEAIDREVKDLFSFIKLGFDEKYPNQWGIIDFINDKLDKAERNLWVRKKRFRRKAYLNEWNYFVTFTYSDEKHDEESFKTKLRKCLSNLHSRRGFNYMGVFERSPGEKRLHFHCLMYVPAGNMIGEIFERREYSTKQHKMVTTHPNDFFEDRFGRCDFEPLTPAQIRRGNTLNYILKYLEKTNERIVYSRGIPSDFYMSISEDDIAAEMIDFCLKYVLFDDVVDYDVNVKHRPRIQYISFEEPLPS